VIWICAGAGIPQARIGHITATQTSPYVSCYFVTARQEEALTLDKRSDYSHCDVMPCSLVTGPF